MMTAQPGGSDVCADYRSGELGTAPGKKLLFERCGDQAPFNLLPIGLMLLSGVALLSPRPVPVFSDRLSS